MALGKMTALILPLANTDAMNLFLEQVSRDFCDYFVIMLVDGAGWHKARALKIPENIRLITQPSHSPELNPAEHLWEELREKYLHNKAFRTLDDVQEALCDGLCDLMNAPHRLRSLTDFPYLRVMNEKANRYEEKTARDLRGSRPYKADHLSARIEQTPILRHI
jgi:hypothetical protein